MKRIGSWARKLSHPWMLVLLIIAFGVAVRLVQYLSDRPLWADEAMLTVNILSRSYRELLTPLDYEQQAPIGFLLVVKGLTMLFGIQEYILRLFPFVASMGSLVLMAILSLDVLPYGFALLALLLFVFSAPLIYYASEVKPYALDLTVGLLLTLLSVRLFRLHATKRRRQMLVLFIIGFVGLWFSQAIVFILAAIGITGMVESVVKRDRPAFIGWFGMSLGWLVSFGLQSLLTLGQYYARYRGVWGENYAPFPLSSMADVQWYANTVMEVLRRPGGISFWPIGLVTFCIGAWYLGTTRKRLFILLVLPGIFALIASIMHYYPFTGRFLLFFAPVLLLCISTGYWRLFSWAWRRPWILMRVLSVIMLGALMWNTVAIGIYRLQNPERFEVITPIIRYYMENRRTGDALYLYYGAAFAFDYYAQRYSIDRKDYINGIERTNDLSVYTQDLRRLNGNIRVWVLFSHIYNWAGIDEEAYFLHELDRMGYRRDEMHTDGASLYLYDFSRSP